MSSEELVAPFRVKLAEVLQLLVEATSVFGPLW